MKSCPNRTLWHRPVGSIRNASVAAIARLVTDREERQRTGLFYTEGMRFVAQALNNRFAKVETVVVSTELLTNLYGRRLLGTLKEQQVPVLEVTPDVFHSLSVAEEPQGIGAVVRQRWQRMARVPPDAGLCWLALDVVRSPGNLGTILRTMDAVGGAGLILLGDTIDPYAPKVIRATMGALFTQRFVRTSEAEFALWRARHGVTLVGTSPRAAVDYTVLHYPERLVLWMGGERKGLSDGQMTICDHTVRIPMVGRTDSLNLATATGVVLYEVFNQRRRQ
jgi:TrmH family RNA methyltransferase